MVVGMVYLEANRQKKTRPFLALKLSASLQVWVDGLVVFHVWFPFTLSKNPGSSPQTTNLSHQ